MYDNPKRVNEHKKLLRPNSERLTSTDGKTRDCELLWVMSKWVRRLAIACALVLIALWLTGCVKREVVYSCPIATEEEVKLPSPDLSTIEGVILGYGDAIEGLKVCNSRIRAINSQL